MAERYYIYRCGGTDSCAVTAKKNEPRLLHSPCPAGWQFWMQITRHQIEDGRSGFVSMPPSPGLRPKAISCSRDRPSCWARTKDHRMSDDTLTVYVFQC